MRIQKLQFAPKITEIISIINSNAETLPIILEKDDSIIENIKQELNNSVRRLKSESAEILSTSFLANEGKCVSPLKDIPWLNKINEELKLKLRHAEDLIISYQEEMDQLKMTILDLQRKLINAENKKETITEGYGENYDTGTDITLQDFSQLQERGMENKHSSSMDVFCNYISFYSEACVVKWRRRLYRIITTNR